MASLKIIEEQIKYIQLRIKDAEENLSIFPNDEVFNKTLNECKKELTQLQQIKDDLKALEVLKDAKEKCQLVFSYQKNYKTDEVELIVKFTTEIENEELIKNALEVKYE